MNKKLMNKSLVWYSTARIVESPNLPFPIRPFHNHIRRRQGGPQWTVVGATFAHSRYFQVPTTSYQKVKIRRATKCAQELVLD